MSAEGETGSSPAKLIHTAVFATYAVASPRSFTDDAEVVVAQPPTNCQPTPGRCLTGKVLHPLKPETYPQTLPALEMSTATKPCQLPGGSGMVSIAMVSRSSSRFDATMTRSSLMSAGVPMPWSCVAPFSEKVAARG